MAMLPPMDISPMSSDSSMLPPPSAFQMPSIPKPPSPDQAPSEASTPPRPSRWGDSSELAAPAPLLTAWQLIVRLHAPPQMMQASSRSQATSTYMVNPATLSMLL